MSVENSKLINQAAEDIKKMEQENQEKNKPKAKQALDAKNRPALNKNDDQTTHGLGGQSKPDQSHGRT